MATKLKTERGFIEDKKYSNSWYKIQFCTWDNSIDLTLADCSRTINWEFGNKNDKRGVARGKAKSAALKKIADKIYAYYHED